MIESRTIRVMAAVFFLLIPGVAAGQGHLGIGFDVERMNVSGIGETSAVQTSLWAEGHLTPLHGIQVTFGRLEEEQTTRDWTPSQGEAPYTIGVEAYPVQVSYVLSLPIQGLPVRPFFRVGGDWARITDRFRSDTPEETVKSTLWGIHYGAGARFLLPHGLSVSAATSYRTFRKEEGRPALSMDLDGWSLGLGLGFRLF